jgi:hypothetical protein
MEAKLENCSINTKKNILVPSVKVDETRLGGHGAPSGYVIAVNTHCGLNQTIVNVRQVSLLPPPQPLGISGVLD